MRLSPHAQWERLWASRIGALTLLVGLVAGLVVVALPAQEAPATAVCPPTTIGDLFPDTTAPPATTTTSSAPTTTVPAPATTMPPAPPTTKPIVTIPTPPTPTTPTPPTTIDPGPPTSITTPPTTGTVVVPTTPTTVPPVTAPPTSPPTSSPTTVPTTEEPEPVELALTPKPTDPTTTTTTTTTTTLESGDENVECLPFAYSLVWPLAGNGQYISPFGASRDGGKRRHKGADIAAPKLMPVRAVADGVAIRVADQVGTDECCWMGLQHNDGWQSWYIHLNNDRYGTDDGLGVGVRPGLVVGTEVAAGEVIGWVGDSGNAENTVPHLHFELRKPDGTAIDPWPSLSHAKAAADLQAEDPIWPYADDDGHPVEPIAALLLTEGLFLPCQDDMVTLCPDTGASAEMAQLIAGFVTNSSPPPLRDISGELAQALGSRTGPWEELVAPLAVRMVEAIRCGTESECIDLGLTTSQAVELAHWVERRNDSEPPTIVSLDEMVIDHGAITFLNAQSETSTPEPVAQVLPKPVDTTVECTGPEAILTRAEALVLLAGDDGERACPRPAPPEAASGTSRGPGRDPQNSGILPHPD